MAHPKNLIGDAFEKFKRSISDEDAHEFASTDLGDVWKAVQELERTQLNRQSAQNLRRIEPLLRGIEQYTKVIEVLCNGTPYMPYVWAPIKFMLQLASTHRDVFDSLLTAYADIGAALPRFDRYEKVFEGNREFQNVLAAVYCGILEFHERAYQFFQRRAWTVIFLSLWKDFQSRFTSIIESLKKQRDFVDIEAASIDILEAKDARARAQYEIERRQKESTEALERNERNEGIARLRHSIEWLAADDTVQETEYERMCGRRHEGTCEWIDRLSQMKRWLKDDTKHSLLWLSGKPGAGKSVMCSHIIGVLDQKEHLNKCYYFCNSQGAGTVCTQILRTIALQLLRYNPDLASLIANEYVYRGSNCGMAQLRVLIPQILELLPYTRVIIDGLDECSIDDQKPILKELQALCLRPTSRCKLLFSSRQDVYIREKLSGNPHILLEKRDEVESDIRLFVKYKMTQLRTSNRSLLRKIESLLVEKANGMFLWVRLVVEELRQCYNDADLDEKTVSLPKGLEQAYGRILDRILDDRNSSIAVRILEWMACSYRLLKCHEILDGISFRAAEHDNNIYHPSCTILNNTKRFQRHVLDLCKPLIEDGPGNTVEFVHFSAKEYILKQKNQDSRPFINTESAHFNISFSCISHLNSTLCLLPINCTDQQRAKIVLQGFHGLHLYASQFWFKHVLVCCGLFAKRRDILPNELLYQLKILLNFRKQTRHDASFSGIAEAETAIIHDSSDSLALKLLPRELRDFIWEVINFRKALSRDESTQKSPEDIAKESCTTDPTHFSKIRYHYQLTLEALLASNAPRTFPWADINQLQIFKETYGPSAFNCRYVHCARATDGFNTSKRRDEHEGAHQRKYHCAQPSCVSFASGFATKRALNQHNDNYHPKIVNNASLSDGIALALRQAPRQRHFNPPGSLQMAQPNTGDFDILLNIRSPINQQSDQKGGASTGMAQFVNGSPFSASIPQEYRPSMLKMPTYKSNEVIGNSAQARESLATMSIDGQGGSLNEPIPQGAPFSHETGQLPQVTLEEKTRGKYNQWVSPNRQTQQINFLGISKDRQSAHIQGAVLQENLPRHLQLTGGFTSLSPLDRDQSNSIPMPRVAPVAAVEPQAPSVVNIPDTQVDQEDWEQLHAHRDVGLKNRKLEPAEPKKERYLVGLDGRGLKWNGALSSQNPPLGTLKPPAHEITGTAAMKKGRGLQASGYGYSVPSLNQLDPGTPSDWQFYPEFGDITGTIAPSPLSTETSASRLISKQGVNTSMVQAPQPQLQKQPRQLQRKKAMSQLHVQHSDGNSDRPDISRTAELKDSAKKQFKVDLKVVKCICDFWTDDCDMMKCNNCDSWQHVGCFLPGYDFSSQVNTYYHHLCADCTLYPLDSLCYKAAAERSTLIRDSLMLHPSETLLDEIIDFKQSGTRKEDKENIWKRPRQTVPPIVAGSALGNNEYASPPAILSLGSLRSSASNFQQSEFQNLGSQNLVIEQSYSESAMSSSQLLEDTSSSMRSAARTSQGADPLHFNRGEAESQPLVNPDWINRELAGDEVRNYVYEYLGKQRTAFVGWQANLSETQRWELISNFMIKNFGDSPKRLELVQGVLMFEESAFHRPSYMAYVSEMRTLSPMRTLGILPDLNRSQGEALAKQPEPEPKEADSSSIQSQIYPVKK